MQIPRVIAAHDLSGLGKCSLTTALPVISACGVEVCPLPTAVLSAHTDFSSYYMFDCTDYLDAYLTSWQQTGEKFDALYSGFLGSARQIGQIEKAIDLFSPRWIFVDPVMGDHGVRYRTYTDELCEKMKRLVARAHLVSPNLTEACILTDTDYAAFVPTSENTKALCRKIGALGAESVILTGIVRDDTLYNCLYTKDGYYELPSPHLPYAISGTGDLFASVLAGKFLAGAPLRQAVQIAADFVYRAMQQSEGKKIVLFENLLHTLYQGDEAR